MDSEEFICKVREEVIREGFNHNPSLSQKYLKKTRDPGQNFVHLGKKVQGKNSVSYFIEDVRGPFKKDIFDNRNKFIQRLDNVNPNPDYLKKEENREEAINDIVFDTLINFNILEYYPGLLADEPINLIKKMTRLVIENIWKNLNKPGIIKSMDDAMDKLKAETKTSWLNKKFNTVYFRRVLHSVVLRAFMCYVPHDDHIKKENYSSFLKKWKYFKEQRDQLPRWDQISKSEQEKIKIIDEDALDLLNFYNAMIRVKSLIKVPTLEVTMDLCSIMLEGNVYINGTGRSLQTECRQVMTRDICGIKKIKTTKKRGLVDTSITDQSNHFKNDFFDNPIMEAVAVSALCKSKQNLANSFVL
jgi:hypothetical protein